MAIAAFSLSKPGERAIEEFLEEQSRLGYSYRDVGASDEGRPSRISSGRELAP